MRCELGRRVAGADVQGYDGGLQVAMCRRFCQKSSRSNWDWTQQTPNKQTNKQNSLDETGSRSRSLRSHGRFVLLFPWRIVGARLAHLQGAGAVATFHFDVAGLVCHSAQDAHFGVSHLLSGVRAEDSNLFVFSTV